MHGTLGRKLSEHSSPRAVSAVVDETDRLSLVSAEGLAPFGDLVRELGGDPIALLWRAGIPPAIIEKQNSRISVAAVARLLEDAAHTLGCPDFGMQLAERKQATSLLAPLARLVCNAPTLGKATHCAIHNMATYGESLRETLEFDSYANLFRLACDLRAEGLPLTPQLSEKTLLLIHNVTLHLTGGAVHSREVWFAHQPISSYKSYRDRFGCLVRFSQECDAIFYTGDDLRHEIVGSNVAAYFAEKDAIAQRGPTDEDVEKVSRDYLHDHLSTAAATRRHLAEYLGTSTRTLHRKLSDAGWTFETLRDDVRRRMATRYLARVDLTLTEVAARLGYSELAVFSRSCQRWFQTTPAKLRRRLVAEQLVPRPRHPAAGRV